MFLDITSHRTITVLSVTVFYCGATSRNKKLCFFLVQLSDNSLFCKNNGFIIIWYSWYRHSSAESFIILLIQFKVQCIIEKKYSSNSKLTKENCQNNVRVTNINLKNTYLELPKVNNTDPFLLLHVIQNIWWYLHMRWELIEVDISVDLYILVIVNVVILIGIHRHQHWANVCLQQVQQTYNSQSCNSFCIFGKRAACIGINKQFCKQYLQCLTTKILHSIIHFSNL